MRTWWRAVVSYPPSWIAIAVVLVAVVVILLLLEPPAFLALVVIGVGLVMSALFFARLA